ncbi:hypothetical protein BDZ94DRAFT_1325406 [Collybia nuda]|uniref:F-box domain-containing protein n=1 Tax=Collybia nuda TaxID=64659 RepID=A0A9P6CF08_9AGAR|nr:hypothetical protein BDZ94DRAFT_1325406 [Collybia nuda]
MKNLDDNITSSQEMIHPKNPLFNFPIITSSPSVPNDADASSARTQIAIAEKEIDRLNAKLSLILAQRARLISHIDQCRMVIAPYKKLPAELVRKIILLCIPQVNESYKYRAGAKKDLDFRLRVTQICGAWRRIALGESTLWDLFIYPQDGHIELAATWFRQSTCTKLGLAVDLEKSLYTKFKLASLTPVITKVIVPHAERLRFLSLTVDKVILQSLSRNSLKNLETLILDLDNKDPGSWRKSDFQFKFPMPSLRSARISIPRGVIDERLLLGLPLAQLTDLKLTGTIVAADLAKVLNQCSSLENFSVRRVYDTRTVGSELFLCPFPPTPINLTHLRHLDVSVVAAAQHLIYLLVIPNLFSLVADINFASPESHRFLQSLLNLRQAYVSGRDADGFIEEGFLSSIPTSEEVFLSMTSVRHSTLIRIGTGELLPKVVKLHFSVDDLQPVLNMLDTRTLNAETHPERISRIKSIKVYYNDKGKRFHDIFDIWRSRGVNVEIAPW